MSLGVDQQVPVIETPGRRRKSAGIAYRARVVGDHRSRPESRKGKRGNLGSRCFGRISVVHLQFSRRLFQRLRNQCCSDTQVDVHNPRVAATLNLLTNGLGHVYLGERGYAGVCRSQT